MERIRRLNYFSKVLGKTFLKYLPQDAVTNCIWQNPLALDGFGLNTFHKLSSNEKRQRQDSNSGLLGKKRERYFCGIPPVQTIRVQNLE